MYPRSKYFATALTTGVGNAKSKSEMEVIDCSHKVLTCNVNFMYGFPIPEDFDDPQGLLHQADLFMMENLKSAVGLLIAKNLSVDAEGACTCSREVKGGQASRELWQVHSGAHRRVGRWPACLLAELALPPNARVAF